MFDQYGMPDQRLIGLPRMPNRGAVGMLGQGAFSQPEEQQAQPAMPPGPPPLHTMDIFNGPQQTQLQFAVGKGGGGTPDQMQALMRAMQSPMDFNGATMTSRETNQPALASFLAGGQVPFGTILSQETHNPVDPQMMARRIAGEGPVTPDINLAALNAFNQMQQGAVGLMGANTQRQIGLGQLGIDQQKYGLAQRAQSLAEQNSADETALKNREQTGREAQMMMQFSPAGRSAAMEQTLLAQPGATPEGVANMMRRAQYQGLFQGNPLMQALGQAGGYGQGGGASANGLTMPQNGQQLGQQQPPMGSPAGNPADSISWKLDPYRGLADPKTGKPGRTVGEFLQNLDMSEPGFVEQNMPAIEAYIGKNWGTEDLQRAGYPVPPEGTPLQTIMDMSPAGSMGRYLAGQMGMGPQVPFSTSNFFINALRNRMNGDVSLTGIQSGDALGRAKLRNYKAQNPGQP